MTHLARRPPVPPPYPPSCPAATAFPSRAPPFQIPCAPSATGRSRRAPGRAGITSSRSSRAAPTAPSCACTRSATARSMPDSRKPRSPAASPTSTACVPPPRWRSSSPGSTLSPRISMRRRARRRRGGVQGGIGEPHSPPPCGEGLGVGVGKSELRMGRRARGVLQPILDRRRVASRPPPLAPPHKGEGNSPLTPPSR